MKYYVRSIFGVLLFLSGLSAGAQEFNLSKSALSFENIKSGSAIASQRLESSAKRKHSDSISSIGPSVLFLAFSATFLSLSISSPSIFSSNTRLNFISYGISKEVVFLTPFYSKG